MLLNLWMFSLNLNIRYNQELNKKLKIMFYHLDEVESSASNRHRSSGCRRRRPEMNQIIVLASQCETFEVS